VRPLMAPPVSVQMKLAPHHSCAANVNAKPHRAVREKIGEAALTLRKAGTWCGEGRMAYQLRGP